MNQYKNISGIQIILPSGKRVPANGVVALTEQEAAQAGGSLQRVDSRGRQLLSEAPLGVAKAVVQEEEKKSSTSEPVVEPEPTPEPEPEPEPTPEPEPEPVVESKPTRRKRSRKKSVSVDIDGDGVADITVSGDVVSSEEE